MPFTKTWDEATPAGSEDTSQGDDRIREFKFGIRERLAIDHYFLATESGDAKIGFHKMLTLIDQSTPAAIAAAVRMYSKQAASESELHIIGPEASEYQLTLNRRLWLSALRVASQAQGDLAYFNGSIWTRLGAGTSGQFLKTQGAGANPTWGTPETASFGYLYGLIIANDTTDATNDLAIGAGVARDDSDTYDIRLASAVIKKGDAAFAAGTTEGGGDISSGAGIKYIYLIGQSGDAAAADILFSASNPGSVSLPDGWDIKRLIGCRRWTGSAWSTFVTYGNGVDKKVCYKSWTDLTNASPSGWTAIDITAYVPAYTSKRCFGSVGPEPGTNTSGAVANDSGTDHSYNKRNSYWYGISAGTSGQPTLQGAWELDVLTANTIYYGGSGTVHVFLGGYYESL